MSDYSTLVAALWPFLPFLVTIVLTIVVAWIAGFVVGRLMWNASPQLSRVARQLTVISIAVVGATLALQFLGVNPAIIFILIVVIAATALIALREVLANYGAKYFSDLFVPFKVGDTIEVRGISGKVIEINPMTTVLLSDKDQLVSVPNESMIREVVVNTSPQAWKEVLIPVTLAGNVDLATFESELLKSLSKLKTRLDPRFPPVLTTKSRTTQSTDLVLTVMLRRPEDRDAITAEANKRLSEMIDKARGTRRSSST
jgi:small conductance mechanosensitive channel